MTTITVKNIPDDLYERLKQAAKTNHRSINSEIIACIERSVSPRPLDIATYLAEARQLREQTADYVLTQAELRQARNEGRP